MTHLQRIIDEIRGDYKLLEAVWLATDNLRLKGYSYTDTAAALGLAKKVGRFYEAFDEYETLMQAIDYQHTLDSYSDINGLSGKKLNEVMRPLVKRIRLAVAKDTAKGNAPKLIYM